MRARARACISVLLSACLAFPQGLLPRAWAGDKDVVIQELTAAGILHGKDDPALAYIVHKGELTPFGRMLNEYVGLRSAHKGNTQLTQASGAFGEVQAALQTAFNDFRNEKGEIDHDERRMQMDKVAALLKGMELDGSRAASQTPAEQAHRVGTEIMAVLTGGRSSGLKPPPQVPIVSGDKTYYMSGGKAVFIVRRDGVVLHSEAVAARQKAFNKSRSELHWESHERPLVLREDGALDFATISSPYYRLRTQLRAMNHAWHAERTYALAEILNKAEGFRPDQYEYETQQREKKDGKTLEEILAEEETGLHHTDPATGKKTAIKAKDLLDPLFARWLGTMGEADRALKAFKGAVDRHQRAGDLSQQAIREVELKEKEVVKLVYMAHFTRALYKLVSSKRKLFSKKVQESMEEAPGGKADLQRMLALRPDLAARMAAVSGRIEQLLRALEGRRFDAFDNPDHPLVRNAVSEMEALGFVIASVQEQLGDVLGYFNTFLMLAGLHKQSEDLTSAGIGTWGSWLVNKAAKGLAAMGVKTERAERAGNLEAGTGIIADAAEIARSGDFGAARTRLMDLDAVAPVAEPGVSKLSANPSREERLGTILGRYQGAMAVQAKQDFGINLGANLLAGAAATAVFAPLAQAALARAAVYVRYAAMAASRVPVAGGVLAWGLRGTSEILRHSAILLGNLNSPTWQNAMPITNRAINALRTEAIVSANIGLVSGGIQVAMREGIPGVMDGDPHSPYRSAGEAFTEGAKSGAEFMIEHPYLLYVGLPTTVFGRGNAVTRTISNFGESGLVGGFGRTFLGRDPAAWAAGKLAAGGGWGSVPGFMVTMTDQVAKYYVGSWAIGKVSKWVSLGGSEYPFDPSKLREPSREQIEQARERIDQAARTSLKWMEWGWLLIPTAKAHPPLGPEREFMLAAHGLKEARSEGGLPTGKLHTLIGSEGRFIEVKTLPKPSLFAILFGRHHEPPPGRQQQYKMTQEMDLAITREVMVRNKLNLTELFSLSKTKDGKVFSKTIDGHLLEITGSQKVRDQALIAFQDFALRQPVEALKLMKRGDLHVKQELARVFHSAYGEHAGVLKGAARVWETFWSRPPGGGAEPVGFVFGPNSSLKTLWRALRGRAEAGSEGGAFGRALEIFRTLLPGGSGRAAVKELVGLSVETLGPNVKTLRHVNDRAAAYDLAASRTARGITPAFEKAATELAVQTDDWIKSGGRSGKPATDFYETVLASWRKAVDGNAELTAAQKATLNAQADYIVSLRDRFTNAEIYNAQGRRIPGLRPKQLSVLVEFLTNTTLAGPERMLRNFPRQAREVLEARHETVTPEAQAAIDKLTGSLKDWSAKGRDPGAFGEAVDGWVKGLKDAKLNPGQRKALQDFGEAVRKDGYEAVVKTPEDVVRHYLLLSTGGGKTLLAFEAILPLAKANAASKRTLLTATLPFVGEVAVPGINFSRSYLAAPKLGFDGISGIGFSRKLVYTTTQSNLAAQARIDFKAFKNVLTQLEIITAEELKSRLAQGRFMGGARASDYWILADELDAMALQPALTVGSEAGRLARFNEAFKGLKDLPGQLERIIAQLKSGEAPGVGRRAKDLLQQFAGRPQDPAVKAFADLAKLKAEHASLLKSARLKGAATDKAMAEALAASEKHYAALRRQLRGLKGLDDVLGGLERALERRAAASRELSTRDPKQTAALEKGLKELEARAASLKDGALLAAQAEIRALAAKLEAPHVSLRRSDALVEGYRKRLVELGKASGRERAAIELGGEATLRHGLKAQAGGGSKRLVSDLAASAADARAEVGRLEARLAKERAADPKAVQVRQLETQVANAKRTLELREESHQRVAKAKDPASGLAARLEELYARMERTVEQPAGERARTLTELKGEHERLVESAVEPANPVYEVFREMKAEIQRWMESPYRRTEGDRTAAMRRLDEVSIQIESKLLENQSKRTVRQVRSLMAEHRALAETIGTRSRLKASVYEPVFQSMLEAGRKGDRARVQELGQTLRKLDQRALNRMSWKSQFEAALPGMEAKYARKFESALWGGGEGFWQGLKEHYFSRPRMEGYERATLMAEMEAALLQAGVRDLLGRLPFAKEFAKRLAKTGNSWVRQELLNLAAGHLDDPGAIRFDSLDQRVHVVHNGEWFENMDTPTRRFWELHYGTDLTLPYEHQSISTVKDIIGNTRVNYVAFSGTLPYELKMHLKSTTIRGLATTPENPAPVPFAGKTQAFAEMLRMAREAVASPSKQTWFILSTRDQRIFRKLLEKGGVPKHEVSRIFSDIEFLRNQRPKADVQGQMNLPGSGRTLERLELARARLEALLSAPDVKGTRGATLDQARGLRAQHAELLAQLNGEGTARFRLAELERALGKERIPEKLEQVLKEEKARLEKNQLGKGDPASQARIKEIDAYFRERLTAAQEQALRADHRAAQADLARIRKESSAAFEAVFDGMVQAHLAGDAARVKALAAEAQKLTEAGTFNKDAKISIVLADARVGGRGLDLAFKEYGKSTRTGTDGKPVDEWLGPAYREFEMVILNPQDLANVHDIQIQGRISPDRVLGSGPGEPAATRKFHYFIDVAAARENPTLQRLAREKGRVIDAAFVIEHLETIQSAVQVKQLESSSVLRPEGRWSTPVDRLLPDMEGEAPPAPKAP